MDGKHRWLSLMMKDLKPGGAGSRRKLWDQKAWAPTEQDVLLERRRQQLGKKEGRKFTFNSVSLGCVRVRSHHCRSLQRKLYLRRSLGFRYSKKMRKHLEQVVQSLLILEQEFQMAQWVNIGEGSSGDEVYSYYGQMVCNSPGYQIIMYIQMALFKCRLLFSRWGR